MLGVTKLSEELDGIRSRLVKITRNNWASSEFTDEAMPMVLKLIGLTEDEKARQDTMLIGSNNSR